MMENIYSLRTDNTPSQPKLGGIVYSAPVHVTASKAVRDSDQQLLVNLYETYKSAGVLGPQSLREAIDRGRELSSSTQAAPPDTTYVVQQHFYRCEPSEKKGWLVRMLAEQKKKKRPGYSRKPRGKY